MRTNLSAVLGALALSVAIPGCAVGEEDHAGGVDAGSGVISAPGNFTPQVGVNYNGQFETINFHDVDRTHTKWVRGFIDVFQFYENPQKLDSDPRIARFLQLKRRGYKTILNIKWNFHNRSFPRPGSARMKSYKAFLRKLLDRVWDGTDIVVSGNEPFIESRRIERDERLVRFYREMTRFVYRYGKRRGRRIPVYVGSFQNLYSRAWRIPAARQLLTFARNDRNVAGVDLHIHHSRIEEVSSAMTYAARRIRNNQRILVTEFSLMHHWRSKMREKVPLAFARRYGVPATMRNHEYINRALKNPVPREQWVAFLRESYWFENRTRYLRNAYQRMTNFKKFFIATYGIRQSFPLSATFTANTDPWILNGLYANRTVKPRPDNGANRFNYAWFLDFRDIQRGAFD